MTTGGPVRATAALVLSTLLAGAPGARAAPLVVARAEGDRRAQLGDLVEDVELRTLDGRKERLLAKGARVNVLVFVRTEQKHSADTLKALAAQEAEFAQRAVRWVAIVSDSASADDVRALVAASGIRMPVLLDAGDAVYAALGVRLHPVIAMVDASRKLVAWEPFRQINYAERSRVRVRWALGEVSEAEVAKVDAPEEAPNRSTDEGRARRHVNYARMLLKMGDHAQALAEVRKALEMAPSAVAYALEGEVLAAMGKCPDATRAFDAALKIEPTNATVAQVKRSCCGG